MRSSIVEKLVAVLTLVSEAKRPPTFSELVSISGFNKSTTHRLLALAVEAQLLQFDKERKAYLLGSKIFDMVRNAYNGYDIQIIALGEMMRLHELIEENVTIGVPAGPDTIYLRVLEAKKPMGTAHRPGMREPFHCSASGKALLAFMPDRVIDAKLAAHDFERFTDNTITTPEAYKQALEIVRNTGFGTNDREEYDHLVGISAPIFNFIGEPIAVLNIWTLHHRQSIAQLSTWSDELIASAARVTELIGGAAPS
ncbi:IclR family transcriptional regulator, partial [Pelagibius litoralis]